MKVIGEVVKKGKVKVRISGGFFWNRETIEPFCNTATLIYYIYQTSSNYSQISSLYTGWWSFPSHLSTVLKLGNYCYWLKCSLPFNTLVKNLYNILIFIYDSIFYLEKTPFNFA